MTQVSRKGFKPGLIFLAALIAMSLVVALAWPLLTRSGHSQTGSTVTLNLSSAPQSLDIRTESSPAVTQALLGNVYETLVTVTDGKPQAGVASSWDISGDGLTYTFHFPQGQTFEDGSSLDSNSALWSLQQIIDQQYVGYQDLDVLGRVTNPDPQTLVLELKHPDYSLLYRLAGRSGIVYNRAARVNYAQSSAGSGPFTVDEWKPGKSLTLKRSDNYHGSHQASSDRVVFSYKAPAQGVAQAISDHTIDAAVNVDDATANKAQALKDKGLIVNSGLTRHNLVLAFNNSKDSILSDQRFREAVRYGVDRQAIASSFGSQAKVLNGPLNELSPGFDPQYAPFQHDTRKASSLAAYFNPSYYHGRVRLVYQNSLGASIGDLISSQLRQVGIPVEVTRLDDNAFQEQVINNHDYELTLVSMTNAEVEQFSDPTSTTLFDDPECQQIYQQVEAAKTQAAYADQLKQYAQTVSSKSASDWLLARTTVSITAPGVRGLPANMADEYLPVWKLKKS